MTGIATGIEACLNSALNMLPNLPVVQWPNTDYTPVSGIPYISPTFLPATGSLNTLSGIYLNKGIYQINIYVPINLGISLLTGYLDAIQTLYSSNKTLTNGIITVFVQDIVLGKENRNEAWYSGMIEIHYQCYA